MNIHAPLWHRSDVVRSGDQLSRGERAADRLKRSFGSWTFLITLNAFIAVWVGINVVLGHPFDPYPFILLNLIFSWIAAMQGGALQIAANRGDRIASEVALHTEKTTDELLTINQGQLEILRRLESLQAAIEDRE